MWYGYGSLLLAAHEALAAPSPARRSAAPTVTVQNGTLAGVHSAEYNQDFFLGIPYAQPPVGDLRLRIAQSINTTWEGTQDASTYSKECVGYGSDQFPYEVSEDCLYLNVVRPSGYENESLPVAFWIHGGGYAEGGAIDQRYNLSFIVQNAVDIGKPFIGVSTNYRLSAWGFLMGDDVQASGQTNIGLRDQRLALHWVQENIAAFGGDPTKVTIWGESAGASSVGFHLTAYRGRDDGLFRGAMMQSGSPVYYEGFNDSTGFQPKYESFLVSAGCSNATDSLQCLRDLTYEDLNAAINQTDFLSWGPSIDYDFLQGLMSEQLAKGEFVKVPIIIGANSDEGTAFGPDYINNTADFVDYMISFGVPENFTSSITAAYPDIPAVGIPGSPPSGPLPPDFRPSQPWGAQYRRSAAYFGDYYFIANRRFTCESWASFNISAYCYRFNAIPAGIPQMTAATHFQEVAFVFYNLLGVGYIEPISTPPFQGLGQNYADLAKLVSASWVSFIVDGNPNGYNLQGNASTGPWPKYDLAQPLDFVFDANTTSHAESDTFRADGIALINSNAVSVYNR